MTKKLAIILGLTALLLLGIAGIKFSGIGQQQEGVLGIAEAAQSFVPDPNSPIGKGEHPRLYLTKDNLPGIRSKIEAQFFNEYQLFIDAVEAGFSQTASAYWAGRLAFVHLMGAIDGINYHGRTMDDYATKAEELAQSVADDVINQGGIEEDKDAYLGGSLSLGLAVTYDWLFDKLTSQTKNKIVDALIANYNYNPTGGNPLWNIDLGKNHGQAFGMVFYGDGINDTKAQEMVDGFINIWIGAMEAQNEIANQWGGWHEGNYYFAVSLGNSIEPLVAWQTATGENILANWNFFRSYPYHLLYNLKPSRWPFLMKYNNMREDVALQEKLTNDGAALLLTAFAYAHAGLYKDIDPDASSLSKWLIDTYDMKFRYTSTASSWLFPYFIYGDKNIIAKSPDELNLPLTIKQDGMGIVYMRTGFDNSPTSVDTLAAFYAQPHWYGIHGHHTSGGFVIEKYGNLVLDAGWKDQGYGNYGRSTMAHNTMIIYNPDEEMLYGPNDEWNDGGQRTDFDDSNPDSYEYDLGGIVGSEFTNDYDYINSDITKAYNSDLVTEQYPLWAKPKIRIFEREFVHLGPSTQNGDDEYFVIFDRIESKINPNTGTPYVKKWIMNTAFEPEINGSRVTVTNNYKTNHGRLYSATLLPANFQINKVQGFLDAEGNAMDVLPSTEEEQAWVGGWRIEVESTTGEQYDNFLHVLQVGDSNILTEMQPTVKVDGDTMVGAQIQDNTLEHKVVMFSKTEENQTQVAYSISSSQPVKHLIADLYPSASYEVYQDGKQIDTVGVSEAGTIYFTSSGGGDFQIIGVGINIPPTVKVSANPTSGIAPLTVQFTATAQDSDGSISSYSWDFGDSQTSTEQNPSHTYAKAGTYPAKVTVTDNQGAKANDTIAITVNTPPADSTPPTIPQGLSIIGKNETSISLTWQASSDPETGVKSYKIYRDNILITTIQQTNYTDTGLTVNTTYSYQVSAVNGAGLESAKSTAQSVTTQADTTPPTVVSVTTESTTQVKIVFSETIEQKSAEEPSNYNIDQGITILTASLAPNQTTVTLITSVLNEQSTYTLTINNIIDGATYPNTIVPNTKVTFRGTNFIAHWTFDEGTGQTARDSSPSQNNHGTIYGATWTTGKINGALEFNGTNAYVEVPSSQELKLTNSGTIAAWINVNTLPETTLTTIIHRGISRYSSGIRYSLYFGKGSYSDRIYVVISDGSSGQSWQPNVPSFSTNTWYHIAATWDGNSISFYLNGVKEDDIIQTAIPGQDDGKITIGAYYDTYYFDGLIDDVRIYDRGLSAEEILALYQPPTPTPQLTLTKTATINNQPAIEAKQGDIITYAITYTNTGNGEAKNVVITDPIPAGTSYVLNSAKFISGQTGIIDDKTATIKWTILSVPAGQGGSVEMKVRVE